MKLCPFNIDGPQYQRWSNHAAMSRVSQLHNKLHTMQDWVRSIDPVVPDYIMMPCVKFQAKLRYHRLHNNRIEMLDRFDRLWFVFMTAADEVLPAMDKGAIEAWWTISKKGKAFGLLADLATPLHISIPTNEDVPFMLESVTDLKQVYPEFEAMAV